MRGRICRPTTPLPVTGSGSTSTSTLCWHRSSRPEADWYSRVTQQGDSSLLDAETGKELWSFRTGSGHRGSAVTYSVDGRQYIATPSGWGSALAGLTTQLWPEAEDFPTGSSIFVFALPEDSE